MKFKIYIFLFLSVLYLNQSLAVGILLSGDDKALVMDKISDYSEHYVVESKAVEKGPTGEVFVRTIILATINPKATVGELNSILKKTGAKIISSQKGSVSVKLVIPDPGTLSKAFAISKALEDSIAIQLALIYRLMDLN